MIVLVDGLIFALGTGIQRAKVLAYDKDKKTLVLRSCGNDILGEVKAEDVKGIELEGIIRFNMKVNSVTWF